MMTLDEFKKIVGDDTLTEDEITNKFLEEKRKHDTEVNRIVNGYEKLDMDRFIKQIGGQHKIDNMHKINEKLDRSELINGKLIPKQKTKERENLEEWKKGFMEGFEEAYKRLMGNKF